MGDARRIVFDLGELAASYARVTVNGREVAKLWCAPFCVDLTDALKDGPNEIAVDVTSTWHNRLIIDAGLPEAKRQTWTIVEEKFLNKDMPFAPSGWVGPACLRWEAP